jgi:hypothetical protein
MILAFYFRLQPFFEKGNGWLSFEASASDNLGVSKKVY